MTKHAIIYDRASTQMQKDNWSRVNAKEVGIRIAEQNGFTWEYVKEIGSGTTLTGRPKMMAILDRIAAGEIQIIIVQDLDRLARPIERATYETIRNICLENNILVHTHTGGVFDFADDDSDFVADINMAVAKKERQRMIKRMKRSKKSKAEAGKFLGGKAPFGYKIQYSDKNKDRKGTGKLIIEKTEAEIVQFIFDTLLKTGGNMGGTAKMVNEAGFTGKTGRPFMPNTIRKIANRRLYIGIYQSAMTDKINHRPDLQIINGQLFERVQRLIKSRAGKGRDLGRRGRYIFTGFVVCGGCGGPMVASKKASGNVYYECTNKRKYGNTICTSSNSYSEHLILPPIIDFMSNFIQQQIDSFHNTLESAATQYGKTISEEALEAAIQGQLISVQASKERIIDAIGLGIISTQEATNKLDDLREQEQVALTELASIHQKAAIMAEWQEALEKLKGLELKEALLILAHDKPLSFRRILSLVFEPNSLRVKTEHVAGHTWRGVLKSYSISEFAQTEQEIYTTSLDNIT